MPFTAFLQLLAIQQPTWHDKAWLGGGMRQRGKQRCFSHCGRHAIQCSCVAAARNTSHFCISSLTSCDNVSTSGRTMEGATCAQAIDARVAAPHASVVARSYAYQYHTACTRHDTHSEAAQQSCQHSPVFHYRFH
eukprot:164436-Amphidinium_carterae.1